LSNRRHSWGIINHIAEGENPTMARRVGEKAITGDG
jgi:hypothetical protein